MTKDIAPFDTFSLPPGIVADLRSDHAGECGAVNIYRGILAVSRHPEVRRFARAHLRTEVRHRRFFDRWLPRPLHSRLLPLWNAAGFSLGAVAALFGPASVFRTIAAVETFVERHYQEQIEALSGQREFAPLVALLQRFCDDEVEHRVDAAGRLQQEPGAVGRIWAHIVGAGSSAGVAVARRI